jgi:hypothetical protein
LKYSSMPNGYRHSKFKILLSHLMQSGIILQRKLSFLLTQSLGLLIAKDRENPSTGIFASNWNTVCIWTLNNIFTLGCHDERTRRIIILRFMIQRCVPSFIFSFYFQDSINL